MQTASLHATAFRKKQFEILIYLEQQNILIYPSTGFEHLELLSTGAFRAFLLGLGLRQTRLPAHRNQEVLPPEIR